MDGTSYRTQKRVMAGKMGSEGESGGTQGRGWFLSWSDCADQRQCGWSVYPIPLSSGMLRSWDWFTWGWVSMIRHNWGTACPKKPFLKQWSPKGSRYPYAQKTLQISYTLGSLHLIKLIFLFQFDCLTLSIFPSGPLEMPSLVIFTLNYSHVINGIPSTMFSENKRWVFRWLPSLILIGFQSNLRHM